jgi:hypothetical protein
MSAIRQVFQVTPEAAEPENQQIQSPGFTTQAGQ